MSVPLGFRMAYSASGAGDSAASMDDDDDDESVQGKLQVADYPAYAEVAILPRRVAMPSGQQAPDVHSISTDMRLSPHGSIPVDVAHVMTIYLRGKGEGERYNVLNVDYNGGRDTGCAPIVTGKRHTWSGAIPSAIDDDDDDSTDEADAKRFKASMDSVA